jgi:putative transposase
MPQTYCSDLLHCVFSTKEHRKLIAEKQSGLWSFLARSPRKRGFKALIVGGTEDHVHLPLFPPATMLLAKTVQAEGRLIVVDE